MQRIKALIGVLLVVGCFYYGWKILPPYMADYQFQQEIQTIARNNEYGPFNTDSIREQVKKKIEETGVPIAPESVILYRTGNNDVIIGANYTVHVDAIFPFDMTFHPAAKNGTKTDPVSPLTP